MSTRRVVTTWRADEDIATAIEHYNVQGAYKVSMEVVDALEVVWSLIGEHPQIGSIQVGSEIGFPELRTMSLWKFPYLVFYTDDADAVRVHRVLHTARDVSAEILT